MRKLLTVGLLSASLLASPTPVTAARPSCATPAMNKLALDAGWPAAQLPRVMRVMWRESRCQSNARNKWATGLMQIHRINLRWLSSSPLHIVHRGELLSPMRNLQAAHAVWVRQGWAAWGGAGK
jgi:hypothetical protein